MSLQVTFTHIAAWAGVSKGNIIVKNISGTTLKNWSVKLVNPNFTIKDIYNMNYNDNTLSGKEWSANLAAGQSIISDFMYEGPKEFEVDAESDDVILKGVSQPAKPEPTPTPTPPKSPDNKTLNITITNNSDVELVIKPGESITLKTDPQTLS